MKEFSVEIKEHLIGLYGDIQSQPWMFLKPLEEMTRDELIKWGYESHERSVMTCGGYNDMSHQVSKLLQCMDLILSQNELQNCIEIARKAIEDYNES
ncbi:hypothetical protein [Brevibacillus sp. 179-C9.3 HS]|uniref:hypothetical protein n=1 Tax=unclassified Brevibacillus TaxID=2684853 RepID=UPI00399F8ECE